MIVLDASAAVELLLRTRRGSEVARRISDPAVTLHAPHLIDVEVLHAVRRAALVGDMSMSHAEVALHWFSNLDLTRYAPADLWRRMWALRANLSAYDAAYIALAEALGATVLTADARLGTAPGHQAAVSVV